MFDFLKPRWKKEAKLLHKGSKKFIHYKRDLLPEDRIAEIESRRVDLRTALKGGDRQAVEEAGKQLRATCEQALPRQVHQTWWEENVEVIWVALVVALGIRAYLVQPFRIPTGSMQPTLNGIIVDGDSGEEAPWFGKRAFEWIWTGKTYKNLVADRAKTVVSTRDASWFLFTRTEVLFDDRSRLKLPAAQGEVNRLVGMRYERRPDGKIVSRGGKSYEAGDPILKGTIVTGDLVLVDKVSYHFRKPERGEVFVFDTRAIPTDGTRGIAALAGQEGGTHYIKRLCGVPGDALSIQSPNLLNHGKILQEPGIARVSRAEGAYGENNPHGYQLAKPSDDHPRAPLDESGEPLLALEDEAPPGLREYAAFGDNTGNSLDSRYWGPVHEFNLVGPGLFALWPFGSGHWGFIR